MAPVFKALATVLSLSFVAQLSTAAPVPGVGLSIRQLAGEGAACDSILTSTDNGVGYGVENAEDNTANTIKGTGVRRQLAGEGAACNSLLSSTDNGVGYGVENAEDNTADNINKAKGGVNPRSRALTRRQGDKIANGAANVLNAAGQPGVAGVVQTVGDKSDGALTEDAATVGAQAGDIEDSTLEGAGSQVPKL